MISIFLNLMGNRNRLHRGTGNGSSEQVLEGIIGIIKHHLRSEGHTSIVHGGWWSCSLLSSTFPRPTPVPIQQASARHGRLRPLAVAAAAGRRPHCARRGRAATNRAAWQRPGPPFRVTASKPSSICLENQDKFVLRIIPVSSCLWSHLNF